MSSKLINFEIRDELLEKVEKVRAKELRPYASVSRIALEKYCDEALKENAK